MQQVYEEAKFANAEIESYSKPKSALNTLEKIQKMKDAVLDKMKSSEETKY